MARRACLALLGVLCTLPSSYGFAAWLKCGRELEEGEVIMNNKVRNAPTEGPVVKLVVYDASGARVDVPSEEDGGDYIVWIDEPSSHRSLSFTIKMDHESIEGLSDIQYVVETAPFEGVEVAKSDPPSKSPSPSHGSYPSPSPSPSVPTIHSIPPESSFVSASNGGGILCDGRRGHARGKNGSVKYELVSQKGGEDDDLLAEIVAGYSEYHGPVTLTPRVLFKRKDGNVEDAHGEL